jgi:hypothetical protein
MRARYGPDTMYSIVPDSPFISRNEKWPANRTILIPSELHSTTAARSSAAIRWGFMNGGEAWEDQTPKFDQKTPLEPTPNGPGYFAGRGGRSGFVCRPFTASMPFSKHRSGIWEDGTETR